jgi:[ribosomal protein S5]-alanine N-acetyltransferase
MNSFPKKILETERVWLREITPDDATFFYLLNTDPEVIRYTGDSAFKDVEEAHRFLSNYDQYRKYGIGRWAVIEKTKNKILGWCGLKYSPDLDEYDIGFRFFREHWNQGYATESAGACVKFGFAFKGMPMIVGRAMKLNTASIRVLSKIGLTYWKDDACGMADGVVYKIEKSGESAVPQSC